MGSLVEFYSILCGLEECLSYASMPRLLMKKIDPLFDIYFLSIMIFPTSASIEVNAFTIEMRRKYVRMRRIFWNVNLNEWSI